MSYILAYDLHILLLGLDHPPEGLFIHEGDRIHNSSQFCTLFSARFSRSEEFVYVVVVVSINVSFLTVILFLLVGSLDQ